MTFNDQIPQPADIIATSQGQLLINDQQLNLVYGTSGDHFAWNNTTSNEQNKHAKVSLPGLPTTNPPGNVLPTPGVSEGALFAITDGTDSTRPFWRRDNNNGTSEYSLLSIRAFGSFAGVTAATINAMNLSAVRTSLGVYRLTLTDNAVVGVIFGVLVGVGLTLLNFNRTGVYSIIDDVTVDVAFRNSTGLLADPNQFTVAILQF